MVKIRRGSRNRDLTPTGSLKIYPNNMLIWDDRVQNHTINTVSPAQLLYSYNDREEEREQGMDYFHRTKISWWVFLFVTTGSIKQDTQGLRRHLHSPMNTAATLMTSAGRAWALKALQQKKNLKPWRPLYPTQTPWGPSVTTVKALPHFKPTWNYHMPSNAVYLQP